MAKIMNCPKCNEVMVLLKQPDIMQKNTNIVKAYKCQNKNCKYYNLAYYPDADKPWKS